MRTYKILPTTDLIYRYLRKKRQAWKRKSWALSSNHKSSLSLFTTSPFHHISRGALSLFSGAETPEKRGIDGGRQTERKSVWTWLRAKSQAVQRKSARFTGSADFLVKVVLTCTGTSLIAQGLWFGESQDVWDSGGNGAANMKVLLWSLFVR